MDDLLATTGLFFSLFITSRFIQGKRWFLLVVQWLLQTKDTVSLRLNYFENSE